MRSPLLALVPLFSVAAVATAQTPPAPPAPATPPAASSAPATPPAPPAPITVAQVDREAALKVGRYVATWANLGVVDSLLTLADGAVGTPEEVRSRLASGLEQFATQLGAELKVTEERVMVVNGAAQYWRTAEYSGVPQMSLVLRVLLTQGGKWRGFTVTPTNELPTGGEEVKP
jgi:3-oxoacyl-ACP reductase-like protein